RLLGRAAFQAAGHARYRLAENELVESGRVMGNVEARAGSDFQHAPLGCSEQVAATPGHAATFSEPDEGVVDESAEALVEGDGLCVVHTTDSTAAAVPRLPTIRPSAVTGFGHLQSRPSRAALATAAARDGS